VCVWCLQAEVSVLTYSVEVLEATQAQIMSVVDKVEKSQGIQVRGGEEEGERGMHIRVYRICPNKELNLKLPCCYLAAILLQSPTLRAIRLGNIDICSSRATSAADVNVAKSDCPCCCVWRLIPVT
jgi:hypothetical protein